MTLENTHSEKDPTTIERESARRVLEYAEHGLRKEAPVLLRLLQARHELFFMESSDFSQETSLEEQLYDDPFYNDAFYVKDLRVRTGAEYHKEKESYDPIRNSVDADGNPTPENDDSEEQLSIKKRSELLFFPAPNQKGMYHKSSAPQKTLSILV